MTNEQRLKLLRVPDHPVDVVLDTDTYNEIDDQFALSYLLLSGEKLTTKAIFAAPFHNLHSDSPEDGMEKSYREIMRLLCLSRREDLFSATFKGSRTYLPDEKTPVPSPAADALIALSQNYSTENPLYVVSIGAITNIASALLLDATLSNRIVIVWLGGTAPWFPSCMEFNLSQDIAAARVVFNSGAPIIQLPCAGVVDHFLTTAPELNFWLTGKNPLANDLAVRTIREAEVYAKGKPWSRVIWDVTAVAWLLNDHDRFMNWQIIPTLLPTYDNRYTVPDPSRAPMISVTNIHRDALFEDLFKKLRAFH